MSQSTEPTVSTEQVKTLARTLGADAVGVARAGPVAAKEQFLSWLAAGFAADMAYLHRYADQRFHPAALLPGATSVLVVGLNYRPSEHESGGPYRVAKYAWGEDYHRVLRRLLRRLRSRLRGQDPGLAARLCVDTAPFPDKYWAAQAGLGWQGKHTNLVSQRFGSFLLLGSLILNRAFDRYDGPGQDFCGSCDACLQVCPTAAFPQPYLLDARKCLSYWTIETGARPLPVGVAEHLEARVFGCDDCLDVCPWNRFSTPTSHPEMRRTEAVEFVESGRVSELDHEEFRRVFAGSAMTRAGKDGLERNQRAAESAMAGR